MNNFIGVVINNRPGAGLLKTDLRELSLLDWPFGEQLPPIGRQLHLYPTAFPRLVQK
ncbi:MAG: hypothetical protein ACE5K8_07500 [Candidatus Zixiibacteriota bacterium]